MAPAESCLDALERLDAPQCDDVALSQDAAVSSVTPAFLDVSGGISTCLDALEHLDADCGEVALSGAPGTAACLDALEQLDADCGDVALSGTPGTAACLDALEQLDVEICDAPVAAACLGASKQLDSECGGAECGDARPPVRGLMATLADTSAGNMRSSVHAKLNSLLGAESPLNVSVVLSTSDDLSLVGRSCIAVYCCKACWSACVSTTFHASMVVSLSLTLGRQCSSSLRNSEFAWMIITSLIRGAGCVVRR